MSALGVKRTSARANGAWRRRTLPTTLDTSESDGGSNAVTFTRIIVMPDGQKWIEGVTPKQLPAPASHTLPNSEWPTSDTSDNNDLDDYTSCLHLSWTNIAAS